VSDSVTKLRATYELPVLAMSIEEARAAIGISWDLWNEYVAPEVKIVRLGRKKLVPVAELQRFLAEHAERAFDDD
jgi:hypothetical protein